MSIDTTLAMLFKLIEGAPKTRWVSTEKTNVKFKDGTEASRRQTNAAA
jgi:hypothetical protein